MANLEHAEDDSKQVKMSGEPPAVCALVQPGGAPCAPDLTPCGIPSFAAAAELLSAPYSCLVMNTHRRHVTLPAMYLQKKRTGIRSELESELLKFSESLKGVPLAYDDVRILGPRGDIYDDSSYIHMDIEANFIVFQPQKGQKLLGNVNKLGVGHVGCLVHGCFNASIPRPTLVSLETWRDAGPRIGSELEFEVTALDSDNAGVLLIRGRLDKTRVQELVSAGEISETSVSTEQPDAAAADEEPNSETTPEGAPVKKKKKKKDKVKEERESEETPSRLQEDVGAQEPMDDANGNEASAKKKKKKKKKEERLKEEEEEVEVSVTDIHGSDSSGYISDKPKSKKRKHETCRDVTSELTEESEPPKSKKKRKKEIEQFA